MDFSDRLADTARSRKRPKLNGLPADRYEQDTFSLEGRIHLFEDTLKFRQTKRIPVLSNICTWKVLDCGYTFRQALYDWDLMFNIMCSFHERYVFDCYMDTGSKNPFSFTETLNGDRYELNENTQTICAKDKSYFYDDEYEELISDPKKFLWSKVLPRKYEGFASEDSFRKFQKALEEYEKLTEFKKNISEKFTAEYSVPNYSRTFLSYGFESLYCYLRGISATAIDIKKRCRELIDASEVLSGLNSVEEAVSRACSPEAKKDSVFDIAVPMLGHGILSVSQFEKIYWPFLKRLIRRAEESSITVSLFCEADIMRFADFFQDVPKGILNIHIEEDDIFEMRKKLPSVCLTGGMPSELLGMSDPKTCVDYAKKLTDEMGRGYIFSQNKMISFENDCRRENLSAVNDFLKNYRL